MTTASPPLAPAPGSTTVAADRRVTGLIWIPVVFIGLYYGLPALLSLPLPEAVLVVVTGVIGCGIALLRHSRPRVALGVAIACLLLSPVALGGVVGVVASRARHLPARRGLPELVAWVAAAIVAKAAQLAVPVYGGSWSPAATVELTISVSMIGFALLAGLLGRSIAQSSVAERTAQQSRAAEIRLEERARIAREMHDVVAHRISLVAMTSGALVHRQDLPSDAREAATIIQSNARQALSELRAVLSDLRDPSAASPGAAPGPAAPPEPQPSLEHLPVLLAEAREVTDVKLTCDVDLAQVPPTTGRQLYRVVQEGLTNARKHAPGQPVSIIIEAAGDDIVVLVRNPMNDDPGDTRRGDGDLAGGRGGYGLVGIQERARLLGGRAAVEIVDSRFVLTVRVPARLAS